MAKRLSETILASRAPGDEIGRLICRNCGGGIIVDAADHRSANLPHRRVCRKCGVEYGTTRAPLHPPTLEYSTAPADFYSKSA